MDWIICISVTINQNWPSVILSPRIYQVMPAQSRCQKQRFCLVFFKSIYNSSALQLIVMSRTSLWPLFHPPYSLSESCIPSPSRPLHISNLCCLFSSSLASTDAQLCLSFLSALLHCHNQESSQLSRYIQGLFCLPHASQKLFVAWHQTPLLF